MALQLNVYNLTGEDPATWWQYHDQLRNDMLDNKENEEWDESHNISMKNAREECKRLWKHQKKKIQQNFPMPCTHPQGKMCWRDGCQYEVSWQWGEDKKWCCGDTCVDVHTGPHASHYMKMHCIKMELQRYWENVERELDGMHALEAVSTPPSSPIRFSFDSPTSVQEHGLFTMDDIMPMDLNELDLYCHETLSVELKEAGCEDLLTL